MLSSGLSRSPKTNFGPLSRLESHSKVLNLPTFDDNYGVIDGAIGVDEINFSNVKTDPTAKSKPVLHPGYTFCRFSIVFQVVMIT
jgi:hypothetical protein